MIHLALQHFSVQTSIASKKSIEVHRLNAQDIRSFHLLRITNPTNHL